MLFLFGDCLNIVQPDLTQLDVVKLDEMIKLNKEDWFVTKMDGCTFDEFDQIINGSIQELLD